MIDLNNLEVAIEGSNTMEKQWVADSCLFKPIWFKEKQEWSSMNWFSDWYKRRGFPNLWKRFEGINPGLKKFLTNQGDFFAGAGLILKKEGNNYKSMVITCLDIDNQIVILINPEVNKTGLKSKITKWVKEIPETIDIIWTKDIDSYCFFTPPKVRFKSFIDQRDYYQHIADEWLKSKNVKQEQVKEELIQV